MLLAPATRPETYAELLRRSFNLHVHAIRRVFFLCVLFSLVVFTPRLIDIYSEKQIFSTSLFSLYTLLYIIIYIVAFWLLAAIFWRVHCVAINRHETYANDFQTARNRILYILGAAGLLLLIACLTSLSIYALYAFLWYTRLLYQESGLPSIFPIFIFLMQGIIFIYMCILSFFYFPLMVIENDSSLLAFKRGVHLIWHNEWRAFCFQLTPWLSYLACLILIKMLLGVDIHIYFVPMQVDPTLYAIFLHIFIFAIFVPWGVSSMLVQLKDLELRKPDR